MEIIALYKYTRPDGGVTVSPNPPEDGDFTEMVRLIANDGYILTNSETECFCVDADSPDGWREAEHTEEEQKS